MIAVGVHVDAGEAVDLIASIRRKMFQYVAVFEETRVVLETAYTSNFATRGALVGGWAPYGTWTPMVGEPATLVRSGRLLESLATLRGAPNDIGPKSATFGTNVPYATFHQSGTREMPMRTIVFEPPGFAQIVSRLVADHLIGDVQAARSMVD